MFCAVKISGAARACSLHSMTDSMVYAVSPYLVLMADSICASGASIIGLQHVKSDDVIQDLCGKLRQRSKENWRYWVSSKPETPTKRAAFMWKHCDVCKPWTWSRQHMAQKRVCDSHAKSVLACQVKVRGAVNEQECIFAYMAAC